MADPWRGIVGQRGRFALQELEQQWGQSKEHPYFPPGWFSIMPGIFHSDAGVPFPAFFPDTAELHWMLWYPPQEDDEDVMREMNPTVKGAFSLRRAPSTRGSSSIRRSSSG